MNPATVDEDLKFVSRCQQGEVDAFEALVEKYQKKMLNVAYRMIGNYDEACEAVQDAFLSAYKALNNFQAESRFSTWLYTIVLNHSRNRLRRMTVRRHREGSSIGGPVESEDPGFRIEPAAQDPPLIDQMEKKEVQERVQNCIHGLDPEHREVLVLRDVRGFTYEEISDILKIPDGTVKSRLFRGRDALRNCLKRSLGDL